MQQFKWIASSALILASVSMAHAEGPMIGGFDGFASVSAGHGNYKDKYGYNDGGLATDVQLALSYTDRSGFGGQVDLGYFKQDYKDHNWNVGFREAAEHLYYRSQGWLAGAFAQQRTYYANGNTFGVKSAFLGLEGQAYLDTMTLYGQLGQGKWKYNYGPDSDPDVLATLELRYFVGENLRVDGSINYMKENFGSPSNNKWDQTTYGIGTEYRFAGSPLSVLAKYEYADESTSWNYSADTQRFMIGVKLNFGKGTLRKSDREGTSLKPVAKDLFWGAA